MANIQPVGLKLVYYDNPSGLKILDDIQVLVKTNKGVVPLTSLKQTNFLEFYPKLPSNYFNMRGDIYKVADAILAFEYIYGPQIAADSKSAKHMCLDIAKHIAKESNCSLEDVCNNTKQISPLVASIIDGYVQYSKYFESADEDDDGSFFSPKS